MATVPARDGGAGFMAVVGLLGLLSLCAVLGLVIHPPEWSGGSLCFGRSGCTPVCRMAGTIADVLEPDAGLHCLCGQAYGTWE